MRVNEKHNIKKELDSNNNKRDVRGKQKTNQGEIKG